MENHSEAPKRRGRPKGSKNKKTRVPMTNPSGTTIQGNGMGLHLGALQVPAGDDVIAAVYDFTNRHQLEGVSVTSTYGLVRNVTLYQPNTHWPLQTYKDAYQLLYLMGNFYGSSSSIRPLSPFPTRHVVSLESNEGLVYAGSVQGKLTAASNVLLGLSFINKTESIKLPLPPAQPAPQNSFDLNRGVRTATGGLLSGAGSSRSATGGLLSGAGSSRSATATVIEFSSGAGSSRSATATLIEFSSGAGRSGADYGGPIASLSPSLIPWNPMTNNFSSTSGPKKERSNY